MKKLALGKGLKALIPDQSVDINLQKGSEGETYQFKDNLTGKQGVIGNISTDSILFNPYQPRKTFSASSLKELKESIIQNGIIQPITVRRKNKKYELISGERRLRACIEASLKIVPAYILDVKTDQQMLELALVENLQREDLNPLEIALTFQALVNEYELTQAEVAKKVGKDRSTVTNFLRLLKLPRQIQESLRLNQISMSHARSLIAIEHKAKQKKVWNKIITQNLNVRQTEILASNVQSVGKSDRSSKKISSKNSSPLDQIEETLRQKLSTKVQIKRNSKGQGTITLSFYSVDELERIFEMIDSIKS